LPKDSKKEGQFYLCYTKWKNNDVKINTDNYRCR